MNQADRSSRRWPLALAVFMLCAGLALSCGVTSRPDGSGGASGGGDGTPVAAKPSKGGGDNPLAGCTICHVDIEKAFASSAHQRKGVGCIKCHGPSEGHVGDENNNVKPDQVFTRKDIDRECIRCHACSRPAAPAGALSAAKPMVCTDCHGSHKTVRKRAPPVK
jgi:hypothetical protein